MKCTQTQCLFHESKGLQHLCPICSDCGAESNIINEDCVNCWNCLKDEGYVREGSHLIIEEEKMKETELECQINIQKGN